MKSIILIERLVVAALVGAGLLALILVLAYPRPCGTGEVARILGDNVYVCR